MIVYILVLGVDMNIYIDKKYRNYLMNSCETVQGSSCGPAYCYLYLNQVKLFELKTIVKCKV